MRTVGPWLPQNHDESQLVPYQLKSYQDQDRQLDYIWV